MKFVTGLFLCGFTPFVLSENTRKRIWIILSVEFFETYDDSEFNFIIWTFLNILLNFPLSITRIKVNKNQSILTNYFFKDFLDL